MNLKIRNAAAVTLVLAGLCAAASAQVPAKPGEWPAWRGPDRTGHSPETGLLKTWGPEGPKLLWKVEGMGGGYSTPSVASGRIYGMGYRGEEEVVWALDEKTGQPAWSYRVASANRAVGYGEGSRCTPTVDGERLYALGVSGDLVCLTAADGKEVWRKNLVSDFGGKIPNWGYSESPLVDGEKVVVAPGGNSASIVALNKASGEAIWKSQVPAPNAAAYSSAIAADVQGQRQYIHYLTGGAVGVDAKDGKFLWKYGSPQNGIVITTPVYKDGHVFATTAYRVGGGVVKLEKTAEGVTANEVYFNPEMQNHHGGVVLLGDHLYYFEGHNPARLVCREFKTGKLAWEEDGKRKGSLVYADGHLYTRNERGDFLVVEATPTAYVPKGKFDQPFRSGKNAWPHPVIAGGKLYLRDQDVLLCYDLKAQ